jgi:hypothetical protein
VSIFRLVLAGTAILLFGLFATEIYDTDFWWHLRTGQYIAESRSLPVPDPFAWTTAAAHDTYAGEARTRRFNLTHEWLAQWMLYGVWRISGFAGVVAVRALSMTVVCGLIGLIAWRARGDVLAAIAASLAAASVFVTFALDRPYQVTFLFLALTMAALEYRRGLWLLPIMFLVWANCHGGYFLGWVVLGAYCVETLVRRKSARQLLLLSAACVAASAVNPNGLGIFRTLLDYRASFLQSKLLEWTAPRLWPPSAFSALLICGAVVMTWQWRKVRIADWLVFLVFGAASLSAQRNIFLTAVVAPVLIVRYLPWATAPSRSRLVSGVSVVWGAWVARGICAVFIASTIARGGMFQFHTAEWRFPTGAANFLREHRVTAPMFNTYEYGGYLIWRLWPQERVFIDGRALSESVFNDYARILYDHDGQAMLDQYGIEVIVMNTFEPSGGLTYSLAPSLADPAKTRWKPVYQDPQAIVFMRTPPAGVVPLSSLEVFSHMESECAVYIEQPPHYTRCARALGQIFVRLGDFARARKWLGAYLDRPHDPDPQADQAWQRLIGMGK